MENDLKGIENYFELTGGSSYRGFELPEVDCIYLGVEIMNSKQQVNEKLGHLVQFRVCR